MKIVANGRIIEQALQISNTFDVEYRSTKWKYGIKITYRPIAN
jgi:hypothetical protein